MVTIRNGELNDLDNITQFHIETWQKSFKSFLPQSFLDNPNYDIILKKHIDFFNNGIIYYLAVDEKNNLIGYSSYGSIRFEKMKSDIELYSIYVKYDFQRQGIGKKLLDEIIKNNIDSISSIGVITMEESPYKLFYEKNKFEKICIHIMNVGGKERNNIIYRKIIK